MDLLRWARIGVRPLCLALLLLLLFGCERDQAKVVNLANRTPLPLTGIPSDRSSLHLAVGSILTPEQGYRYYQQLIDFLAEQLELDISVVDPGNYQKLNHFLESGRVDVAFVCSGPYVEGHDRFGLLLLAAPVAKGKPVYYSNLIVPTRSAARTLADLQGKSFAFTDPKSNSGCLVVKARLAQMGFTPEDFFSSLTHTYAHDLSIHAVADHLVDGAAVDSLIWDYLAAADPRLASRVRVLERYGPYGVPPVVASPKLDPELRERIRQALLNIHKSAKGRDILQAMRVERFALVEDKDYQAIRELLPPNRQDGR